jgi:hypothetical protein
VGLRQKRKKPKRWNDFEILRFKRDQGIRSGLVKRGNLGEKRENDEDDKTAHVDRSTF